MNECILGTCPHASGECKNLHNKCGAKYALRMAQRPEGYQVLIERNPTIEGLKRAGLVQVESTRRSNVGVARAVGS